MPLLPRPRPDEVIGSVIARACFQYGIGMKALMRGIYDGKRSSAPFFMSGDPHRMGGLAGISGKELLLNHTMFPYVVSFMSPEEQEALLAKVLKGQQTDGALASLIQRVVQSVPFRRVCLDCVKAELQIYGQAHWHRAHHLPGVYYCTIHGTRLRNTEIRVTLNRESHRLALPHQVPTFGTRIRLAPAKLQELAIISEAALRSELTFETNWRHAHRDRIRNLGYELNRRDLASHQIAEDVQKFYGKAFLHTIQCEIDLNKPTPWPALVVRTHRNITVPTSKHILMMAFTRLTNGPTSEIPARIPGPKKLDRSEQDRRIAREIKQILRRCKKAGLRLSVAELFPLPRDWASYRHHREYFPRTQELIRSFRLSSQSLRQVGGRPRKSK